MEQESLEIDPHKYGKLISQLSGKRIVIWIWDVFPPKKMVSIHFCHTKIFSK